MLTITKHIRDFFRGFAMAVADSVPGVSGGTIAFLLGFYETFISSIHNFLMGSNAERKAVFPFLFKLGAGWICGFVICVVILATLFHTYIYQISSVFLGLTLVSIPIVLLEEKAAIAGKYQYLILTILGILVVPVLMFFSPAFGSGNVVDLATPSIGLALFLFVAAIVAVSALVLPGISGSTLLLIFGLYVPLISSVSAIIHRDFSYLPMLLVFGVGMIVGLGLSAKVIRHCFNRYRPQTIYLCVGLLIGSIYAIILGPTTLSEPMPVMSLSTFQPVFFILGAAVLVILQLLKHRSAAKTE